ncbi:MAG TPA: TRZ/ATZ family protein [Ruminococcaceae bacterium]|nr:TRZ/ATZ family protein [Oscillospiraceae bacterium]
MTGKRLSVLELSSLAAELSAGERILLSGTVYTARDAAHARMAQSIDRGEPLPFEIRGAAVYYAGPTPAPFGLPIGSCGPTTSSRMDRYTPKLLSLGLAAMIGKGERNAEVCDAIKKYGAVYLCAVGGAGALAAECVKRCEVIAYEDLGCESVKKLEIFEFPLLVAIDAKGGNLFATL